MRGRRPVAGVVLALVGLVGCATLPKHIVRPTSTARLDTASTPLGQMLAPAAAQHPGDSGFVLFNTGERAIQARVALADAAQASIDAQYFIWAGDAVGRVLLDRLVAAADRGVRIRLLIDDYHTRGYDISFAELDAHPNIEVRVFNPFVRGRFRLPQFFGRWAELHHRMHNKMFIVDGRAAVVGGRNLTNDYFGLGETLDFRDFDLFAVGAVVPQAEAAFDRYWNSAWAYPITALRKPASHEELRRARARFAAHVATDRGAFPYALTRTATDALAWLARVAGAVTWAPAEIVYDDPSLMAQPRRSQVTAVGRRLIALTRQTRREVVGENAYLVPHEKPELLRALRARGVTVQLLTNSLASTDVILVNAAYSKSRPAVAELGVELYEMKPYADSRALYLARPGTSRAHLALHGKAAVFDREIVFLGSFNFDPRSMYLDTEAVFVVRSAALADQVVRAFATDFSPANAWRIGHVVGKRKVAWLTDVALPIEVEPHDPASAWRRLLRWLGALLPIRQYL